MKARLFWHKKELKVGEDGLIKFGINGSRYSFQIYDPELFFKVKGELVKVYFDEEEINIVHLFDINSKYLGVINPRLVYDGSNPDIIEQHRLLRKNIEHFAKGKRKKWLTKNQNAAVQGGMPKFEVNNDYQDFLIDNEDPAEKLFIRLNGITSKESFL